MSIFHYNDTPLPVGLRVGMNGSDDSYKLGLYDGSLYAEQWADEPEEGVLFASPEAARRWLEAATAVLTPYIESGDQAARIPEPDGWAIEDER
ncbi:hypothetical protein ACIRN4_06270 [Pimelobacter simplex]|uniref:hypothetical protein n=1 Tax=Nocardioides simplex TaxID=2045 RepID=UPI0037F831BC